MKDADLAVRHSQGRILFYSAGSRNGLKGWAPGGGDTKRKLYLRNIHFSVIEKYVEAVKQGQKNVPDLVE